ncbi:hypothetical protein AAG906_031377 [Vitis piasezkii]
MGLRFVTVLFLLLSTMAWMGWCSRPMRGEDHQYLLQNRLPRGPVPPSGPSPCHHKFSPVSQSGASYTDDSIVCP